MHKIARIAYNTKDWQKPSGDAGGYEIKDTYNHTHGFGHEEWLFRSEWLIDGWRYAFVQGVNKSRKKLVEDGRAFDLTLFTIQPDKRRRYVATIRSVECLDDKQAGEAAGLFKKLGWYKTMLKEINEAGGDASGLGDAKYATSIVNVRYRLENVRWHGPAAYAKEGDPIFKLNRYRLFDFDGIGVRPGNEKKKGRNGSEEPPSAKLFMRRATGPIQCSPEHARMQSRLMEELRTEYPDAKVVREQEFIDVSVTTKAEIILFEIKSDLDPRYVVRQALGQILEYAYHPSRQHRLPVRLVIVGRQPLSSQDALYLKRLKSQFELPLSYRAVEL